jgi:hypothetical protein
MRRLTNPRSIATAILDVVNAGTHYDQGTWFSEEYFADENQVSGGQLRYVFEKNVCGTTACVAGNAVVLTLPEDAKYDWLYSKIIFADGGQQYVEGYAAEVLGLDGSDAGWLFDGDREVEEVKEALELLAAGKSISGLVPECDDDEYDE